MYHIKPIIDVCGSRWSHLCLKTIMQKQNSLLLNWDEDFFMNPPYSKIDQFIKKAYIQHKKNNVSGLILIFAKTDTKFWHQYIEGKAEVHFIKGRIKFWRNGFPTKNSAPYPSVWVIYRKK